MGSFFRSQCGEIWQRHIVPICLADQDQSAPTQFRAALAYLLKQEGRGAQTRLADELKIDRGYLNAIVRGRKSGSEKKRGQIAAHFHLLYEEMLSLGRRILSGEEISKSDDDTANDLPGKVNGDQQEPETNDDRATGKQGQKSENVSKKIITLLQMLESDMYMPKYWTN